MTTSQLTTEQQKTIDTEISPIIREARSLIVKSSDDREYAVGFVKKLKHLRERIEERFHPTSNKQQIYKTYQAAVDTEHAFYDDIDTAGKVTKTLVSKFNLEESLKAQREAAAAEAKRLEAERKEREKLEAQAKKAEEKGKTEKAEVLREQAETVQVAPVFTPSRETKKLVWKARVTNMMQLCKAIGEGQVPYSVLEVRQSALNDFAKGHNGKSPVPGLTFHQEVSTRI